MQCSLHMYLTVLYVGIVQSGILSPGITYIHYLHHVVFSSGRWVHPRQQPKASRQPARLTMAVVTQAMRYATVSCGCATETKRCREAWGKRRTTLVDSESASRHATEGSWHPCRVDGRARNLPMAHCFFSPRLPLAPHAGWTAESHSRLRLTSAPSAGAMCPVG
ncbi:hypothetical protein B0T26DRAFT_450110 [Lasiosphaeria miniovina]|uniref:Uncharacterized protein n=1 Tax=Lasiosphaeria miniovina TaxID=1954250 RepID=A0AA40DMK7_9PEZI|nr:uncharacterized protein B0T26DRAFT_450110 [Lasiosphaeria miniovina]KAK0706357.1 hypothetical protein B0T26DRAFT_450110 [Lasiosphaeria miniovina]